MLCRRFFLRKGYKDPITQPQTWTLLYSIGKGQKKDTLPISGVLPRGCKEKNV
jgi:hypothetical protein